MPEIVNGNTGKQIDRLYDNEEQSRVAKAIFGDAQVKALRRVANDPSFANKSVAQAIYEKNIAPGNKSTAEKKAALLEAAQIVDRENITKKLQVATIFTKSSVLEKERASDQDAVSAARKIVLAALKDEKTSASQYVQNTFNKHHNTVINLEVTPESDKLLFAAKTAWEEAHKEWSALPQDQQTQNAFFERYKDKLFGSKELEEKNFTDSEKNALISPDENPLLACASQLAMMASVALVIDRKFDAMHSLPEENISALASTIEKSGNKVKGILEKIDDALEALKAPQTLSTSKSELSDLKYAEENLNDLKKILGEIEDLTKKLQAALNACGNNYDPTVIEVKEALDAANKKLAALLTSDIATSNLLKTLESETMSAIRTVAKNSGDLADKPLDIAFDEAKLRAKKEANGKYSVSEYVLNQTTKEWELSPLTDKDGNPIRLSEKELDYALEKTAREFKEKHPEYAHLATNELFNKKDNGDHYYITASLRPGSGSLLDRFSAMMGPRNPLEKELLKMLKTNMKTIQENRNADANALGTAGTPENTSLKQSDTQQPQTPTPEEGTPVIEHPSGPKAV